MEAIHTQKHTHILSDTCKHIHIYYLVYAFINVHILVQVLLQITEGCSSSSQQAHRLTHELHKHGSTDELTLLMNPNCRLWCPENTMISVS